VQSVGQAASYSAVALVFIFVLGKVDLQIPFILAMSAGSILSQPLWVRLLAAPRQAPGVHPRRGRLVGGDTELACCRCWAG